jgi:elongation factor P
MALSITDLKKGTVFEYMGSPYRVVEYSQKVMGRGGSIVNVRIKSLIDDKVLDKTFKGNEQLNDAQIEYQNVQFLYKDHNEYHFMNDQTFEQFSLTKDIISDKEYFLIEGDKVVIQLFKSQPINIELPKNINLKVVYAENAVKGDTSSAITKNATLETGLTIKVPAFIKEGDIVSVDTSNSTYRERV